VTPGRRPRILGLDLFRVVVVAFVVSVHTLANAASGVSTPLGAFITVLHTSRELFFLLTAFVLAYNYGQRDGIRWPQFWRRRYVLVVPAYLLWSLVYFFADGRHLDPASAALATLGHDLLTGASRYQMYFLLVTMQVYLAFPVLRWLLRRTAGHHFALFAAALAYQTALTVAIQLDLVRTGLIGAWLHGPDSLLFSYLFYVVAGGLAAWHFDRLAAFTRRHTGWAAPVAVAGVALGVGAYLAQVWAGGMTPGTASAVFQPVVVVESLCFGWALLAAALAWTDAGARHRRLISAGADGSFGIYLAHPLLLQGALALASVTGVLAALRAAPAGLEIAAVLGIGVPLIYGLSGVLVALARRTPLSLPLTGRRMDRRPAASPAPPSPARPAVPTPAAPVWLAPAPSARPSPQPVEEPSCVTPVTPFISPFPLSISTRRSASTSAASAPSSPAATPTG